MGEHEEKLKKLFVEWLKEAAATAEKKGSRAFLLYKRAYENVESFSGEIADPKTLKLIPYVGDKTVKFLVEKLESYCGSNGVDVPASFAGFGGHGRGEKRGREVVDGGEEGAASGKDGEEGDEGDKERDGRWSKKSKTSETTKTTKKSKKSKKDGTTSKRHYIPKKRSGGYAILLGLLLGDRKRNGLCKEELIQVAKPYSEKSFKANPGASDYYSAWSSMKSLLSHDLVGITGRSPRLYFLTDEGLDLANQLKEAEGLGSPQENAAIEFSFDNLVRVTPNSSIASTVQRYSSSPLSGKTVKVKNIFGAETPVSGSKRSVLSDLSNTLLSSPLKRHANADSGISRSQFCLRQQEENGTRTSTSSLASKTKVAHDKANKVYNGVKYDIWLYDEYEVVLFIDTREIRSQQERDFFRDRLSSLGVTCEVRTLSVGDILWIAKHKQTGREVVLNCICERKRLDDLASSIRDGRFHEQKHRLKKTGMKHFYYLVEEMNFNNFSRISDMADALKTAMSMTITGSDFYLKRFKTTDNTITFISSLTTAIKNNFASKNTKLVVVKPTAIESQAQYRDCINTFRTYFETRKTSYECVCLFSSFQDITSKSGMLSVKEMFILMLMAIRGVSIERAASIQNYFKTPKKLLEFYHSDNEHLDEQEKKLLLLNLFQHEIGTKKIGKVLLEKIYDIWGTT